MNLYKETLDILKENNKTFEDVLWICCADFEIPKENFIEIAKNTDYENSFGAQIIASDLIIVGDNWWLERGEYDGSEWWDFKTIPIKPDSIKKIFRLDGGMWNNLKELNP